MISVSSHGKTALTRVWSEAVFLSLVESICLPAVEEERLCFEQGRRMTASPGARTCNASVRDWDDLRCAGSPPQ